MQQPPMPDADTENFLDNARAKATASLKGEVPDSMLSPITAQPRVDIKLGHSSPAPPLPAAPPPSDQAVAPPPEVAAAPPPSPQAIAPPKFTDSLVESAKQLGSETGNGVMRAAATTAKMLGFAAVGANHLVNGDSNTGFDDRVFGFIKNHVDTAYDYWKTDPNNTNPYAQTLGSVAEGVAPAMLGGAAVPAMVANEVTKAGSASVDRGEDVKTAATLATIAGVATALQMKLAPRDPGVVKRIAKWVGAGELVNAASDVATKIVLNNADYKEAAKQIDPLDPNQAAITALMQTVFGILHAPAAAAKINAASEGGHPTAPTASDAAKPPADLKPGTLGEEPPPPGPAAAPPPPATAPPPPAAAPTVADVPSAEPASDLKAQFKDMRDPATPRQGVFLSTDNLAENPWAKARAPAARTVELDNGKLVLKDAATAEAARARIAKGEDPQAVIGEYTGAGTGKTPDMTAVVQGHDEQGNVTKEQAVTPEQIPAAVAATAAEGKTPVVTTPDDAVARRADLIENQSTTPVEESPPKAPGGAAAPEAQASPIKPLAAGDRRMIKISGEDVPVIVASPPAEGKVAVHTLDDDGRPSKTTQNVPEHMFAPRPGAELQDMTKSPDERALERERAAAQRDAEEGIRQEPVPEPIPLRAAEHEGTVARRMAEPELKQALDMFSSQSGGSVQEHAMRVGEFARAVRAEAESADVTGEIKAHAIKAASRVERIDTKSDEAYTKNRGVGHGMLNAHGEELVRAAKNLLDPDNAVIPSKPVAPKADALKARTLKAREKSSESKQTSGASADRAKETARAADKKSEPKVASGIKDVEDETRAKSLSKGENLRIGKALERYRDARGDAVSARHDDLEAMLHEIYGDKRGHEVQNMMQLAREQRADMAEEKGRPRRMSDDITEETMRGEHVDDESLHGDESFDKSAAGRGTKDWTDFHNQLGPMWKRLQQMANEGTAGRAHKVLDHMLATAPEGPIKDLISHLRANVEDVKIEPVHAITDSKGNLEDARGLYDHASNSIQIAAREGEARPANTRTILHELVHAATAKFIHDNPDHPLVKEINGLHDIARARMGDLQAEARAQGKVIYGMRPGEELSRRGDFYGLKDVYEFTAEAAVNPEFQKLMVESSRFARIAENLRNVVTRMGLRVAEMLGIKNPRSVQLLHNTLETTHRIMEAQRSEREASRVPGESSIEQLRHLDEEPPPLPNEEEFRAVTGDHATQVSRLFRRAVRSGAIENVRRNVRAFTSFSQLVRTALRRGVFGAEGGSNPLRQYHETLQDRDAIINRSAHDIGHIVNDRAKLSFTDNKKLGQFQIDSTMYGIDPEGDKALLPKSVTSDKKFEQRWSDFQDRWRALSPEQKEIYRRERDMNERLIRANRKAGVDAALDSYSEYEVSKPVRQLLYSVTQPHQFADLIGTGRNSVLNLGAERNDKLVESLIDLASAHELEGPYFHLGRHGDYVVQANPEGTRKYRTQSDAENFAARINALSPHSKATVEHLGDDWQVDYKADWVSMHESPAAAHAEIERLREQGIDVGSATTKILSARNANLSGGVANLVAEATRRIERRGSDAATRELQDTLRQSFVQLMAARSAYAGSKLARKNVGGVKPEEMGRNFATHAQSIAWNTGQLATAFKQGESLGRLREAVKDSGQAQGVALARGRLYDELTRRLAQENAQFGQHTPFNSILAKAGFANYMMSLSHSMINLTQNFTTAIPVAMARHGSYRALDSFSHSMALIASPAFRETYRAVGLKTDADKMINGIVAAVAKDKRFGKWAQGPNSPLQQLIDRGAIHTSMSNQLAETAKGGNSLVNRTFEYARILPSMADLFNRVSTGLAALELTKGDVYKAGDLIRETHMDYSQQDKPRAFRAVSRLWGGNSVTMFRTYTQGTAHLLYSHVFDGVGGLSEGGRANALKTVAGLMLGTALFGGVQRGMGLEPIRAAMWAYKKLVGDDDEYYSFDNMSRRWVADVVGEGKLADTINHGIPALGNIDISSRMGLSDLFLHDPPDMTSMDDSKWAELGASLLGPSFQEVSNEWRLGHQAFQSGRIADFAKLIPIKGLHDVLKAYAAATTGKTTASGAVVTQPSGYAAGVNFAGFKTNEESKIAEKSETDYDYRQWGEGRKYDFVKRWVQADPADRNKIWEQARSFSLQNPAFRITRQDLIKQTRSIRRTEAIAEGRPSRDRVQNEINDY